MEIVRYAFHVEILANFYGTPAYHFVSNGVVNVPCGQTSRRCTLSTSACSNPATWSSYLPPPPSLPLLVVIPTDKSHFCFLFSVATEGVIHLGEHVFGCGPSAVAVSSSLCCLVNKQFGDWGFSAPFSVNACPDTWVLTPWSVLTRQGCFDKEAIDTHCYSLQIKCRSYLLIIV